MQYTGVYAAFEQAQAYTASRSIIELQVPANTVVEILRVWIGLEGAVADQMQEVALQLNDATGTGTAVTEQPLQAGYPTSAVTAITNLTVEGGTPTVVYPDSFHIQNGWLYLPVPEERIIVTGGSTLDNFNVFLAAAPDASITLSAGVIWGEYTT